jgi:hypothetical protein
VLGSVGLIIGLPALLFALFGWSQTAAHPLFGGYTQYMCAFGGLGAMISGLLMIKEGFQIRNSFAKPVKEPALDFQVWMEKEEEQTVSA